LAQLISLVWRMQICCASGCSSSPDTLPHQHIAHNVVQTST
jgi:hypothetical protein